MAGIWDGLLEAILLVTLVLFMAVEAVDMPRRLAAAARRRPLLVRALRDFARPRTSGSSSARCRPRSSGCSTAAPARCSPSWPRTASSNFLIQPVIPPKVVGDAVGLSTTVSFLSVVFWAAVLGPLGALLAVPLSLLAKALLVDVDPSTQWIAAGRGAAEEAAKRPRLTTEG